jgi:anaerobic dimethyl sulfoxide reductase subunit B (iron-sulfur subunit)
MAKMEYSFSFDKNKCVLCHACETACKVHNMVEQGCSWRQVKILWDGKYPEVTGINLSISCMHCLDPECIKICPEEAISKETNGIVSVDKDRCTGCRLCFDACPVNAPQFGKDGKMQKCNFCLNRIKQDTEPICVATCPGGAINFQLAEKSEKIRFEKEMAEYLIV